MQLAVTPTSCLVQIFPTLYNRGSSCLQQLAVQVTGHKGATLVTKETKQHDEHNHNKSFNFMSSAHEQTRKWCVGQTLRGLQTGSSIALGEVMKILCIKDMYAPVQ